MDIGCELKRLRKKYKLSQRELGGILGVSNQMISKLENNKVNPSNNLLNNIRREFKKEKINFQFEVYKKPEKLYTKDELNQYEKEIIETYESMKIETNQFSRISSINRVLIDINIFLEEKMFVLEGLVDNVNEEILLKIDGQLKTTLKNFERNKRRIEKLTNKGILTVGGEE